MRQVGLLETEIDETWRFRVRKLPALFGPCPMCDGSTDVNFEKGRAVCVLCGQRWDLRRNPVLSERGNEEVWQRRRRFVEERKRGNGNGHKYSFDEPIRLEDLCNAQRI